MKRLAIVVALVACGGGEAKQAGTTPVTLETKADTASEEIEFAVGARKVPGTLVHPTTGKRRAIVLMAGSGPTDRNWNSPLLQGENGSAKLLAEALGHRGFAVLRFDKAMTGGNKIAQDKVTFDTYVEEGRAALAYLRARPDVDATQLYIAGHSEGGIHALRVALAEDKAIAGVVLLASAGRAMVDVMTTQLENQFATAVAAKAIDKATADKEVASVKLAFSLFVQGKDIDPMAVSEIPQLQALVAKIVNPASAALARPLFGFDPASVVGKVHGRVLIYNGAKDLQIDPELDAKRLAAARPDATLVIVPDANHVMKHEPKTIAELRADLATATLNYNAPDATLDTASVDAIAAWLAK